MHRAWDLPHLHLVVIRLRDNAQLRLVVHILLGPHLRRVQHLMRVQELLLLHLEVVMLLLLMMMLLHLLRLLGHRHMMHLLWVLVLGNAPLSMHLVALLLVVH